MKWRIQFVKWLLAAASLTLFVLPCAAQKHDKPPQPQRQQQPKPPRQERRQERQENRRIQNNRPNNDRPRNAAPNREQQNRKPESMGMISGNHPPNARNDAERPNFNPNRPPNASSSTNTKRFQDLSPAEKQKVLENNRKLQKMTPAE